MSLFTTHFTEFDMYWYMTFLSNEKDIANCDSTIFQTERRNKAAKYWSQGCYRKKPALCIWLLGHHQFQHQLMGCWISYSQLNLQYIKVLTGSIIHSINCCVTISTLDKLQMFCLQLCVLFSICRGEHDNQNLGKCLLLPLS